MNDILTLSYFINLSYMPLFVQGDPFLCDLHTAVTLEEVNSYIALEHGQAMTVNIRRADDVILCKHLLLIS